MIPLDQAVVARLESHGARFEVLVDPDEAARLRQGDEVDIEDAAAALYVFESASRAEKASEETLQKVFGTTEFTEIARQIILKGEIQLTSEQRRRMTEDKRLQVISFIAKHAVNPQTGFPHPPTRIAMAMEEAKVHIDPFRHLDVLVRDAMKAIRPLLPIRFEELRIAVKIPADHAARAHHSITTAATLEKEEWQKDGSWICVVRIPAGMQEEFFNLINHLTRGDGEVKLLERHF